MSEAQAQFDLVKGQSLWSDGISRLRRRKLAMVCFWVIMFYIFIACYVQVAEWSGSSWPICVPWI